MRVAFVLRSTEVQLLVGDLCGPYMQKRAIVDVQTACLSPPPCLSLRTDWLIRLDLPISPPSVRTERHSTRTSCWLLLLVVTVSLDMVVVATTADSTGEQSCSLVCMEIRQHPLMGLLCQYTVYTILLVLANWLIVSKLMISIYLSMAVLQRVCVCFSLQHHRK